MFDRRDFLQLAALTMADLTLFGSLTGCTSTSAVPSNVAADPYAPGSGSKGRAVMCLTPHRPGWSYLRVLNWDESTFEDLEIPIGMAHSITIDKNAPHVLYVFEFFGSAVRVDTASRSFKKIDHRDEGSLFSGHGMVCAGSEFIACTSLTPEKSCDLVLRSAKTFQKVSVAPAECGNSHHVVALPGTSLLAIGNLRSPDGKPTGAITFFDTNERRVANRVEFPIPVNHLAPLSATTVVGVSRATSFKSERRVSLNTKNDADQNLMAFAGSSTPIPSPLYVASIDGNHKVISGPKELSMMLDNFGVAKVSDHRFLSAHEGSGKVILWENFEKKHVFDFVKPTNLLTSRDGSEFLVLANRKLKFVSLSTFETLREFEDWPDVASVAAYATT